MIVRMVKLRLLGTRPRLPEVIRLVQDAGVMHLAAPPELLPLQPLLLPPREARRRRQLQVILADVEAVLAAVGQVPPVSPSPECTAHDLAVWARLARRIRRQLDANTARTAALEEEQALLARYHSFLAAFDSLLRAHALMPGAAAFHVVLRPDQAEALPRLREGLARLLDEAVDLFSQKLPGGEIMVLILVPASAAARVDHLLAETRVAELPVPAGYGTSLAEALPRMREREAALPREQELLRRERTDLGRRHRSELARAQSAIRDRLLQLEALPLAGVTPHAFVLEGWLPVAAEADLGAALDRAFGGEVAVERETAEEWRVEDAPVVLRNPRIFRPFEVLIAMVPLPRYGSLDPTPFVAVFFPMFFGLMLGDVGYGIVLTALALLLHWRSRPGSTVRSLAEVGGACATFAIIFGVLFGEYFGDLGHRVLGLRPLAMNREEAIVPFLCLAIALGFVHILLGLILGALSNVRHHPRLAIGRGLTALMLVLVLAAILAAMEIVPRGLLTPTVIALLVTFPLLIVVEGVVGAVELLSTFGHVLSYARIMALGTASVMLAMVANQLAGAMGSAVVGILFALLFHMVNFALGLFSPTIHALRLHYVEFFGTCYSPGGVRYHPLGHWRPLPGSLT